jgi:hypothetical protein
MMAAVVWSICMLNSLPHGFGQAFRLEGLWDAIKTVFRRGFLADPCFFCDSMQGKAFFRVFFGKDFLGIVQILPFFPVH